LYVTPSVAIASFTNCPRFAIVSAGSEARWVRNARQCGRGMRMSSTISS
jgi:hypothetical protein